MNEEWPATASGDDDHENVLMHFLLGPVVFNVKLKSWKTQKLNRIKLPGKRKLLNRDCSVTNRSETREPVDLSVNPKKRSYASDKVGLFWQVVYSLILQTNSCLYIQILYSLYLLAAAVKCWRLKLSKSESLRGEIRLPLVNTSANHQRKRVHPGRVLFIYIMDGELIAKPLINVYKL